VSKNTSFNHSDRYSDTIEEQEAKLAALRAVLIEGEASGPSTPFNAEAFIARKRGDRKLAQ
jgi:Arc/MetJ-type ribon-helix-helix transcriptional regulator